MREREKTVRGQLAVCSADQDRVELAHHLLASELKTVRRLGHGRGHVSLHAKVARRSFKVAGDEEEKARWDELERRREGEGMVWDGEVGRGSGRGRTSRSDPGSSRKP